MANQRIAAALKAEAYTYRCVFAEAGHTDGRVTRQALWNGCSVAAEMSAMLKDMSQLAARTVNFTLFASNGGLGWLGFNGLIMVEGFKVRPTVGQSTAKGRESGLSPHELVSV